VCVCVCVARAPKPVEEDERANELVDEKRRLGDGANDAVGTGLLSDPHCVRLIPIYIYIHIQGDRNVRVLLLYRIYIYIWTRVIYRRRTPIT
jgi:hypothetical protein